MRTRTLLLTVALLSTALASLLAVPATSATAMQPPPCPRWTGVGPVEAGYVTVQQGCYVPRAEPHPGYCNLVGYNCTVGVVTGPGPSPFRASSTTPGPAIMCSQSVTVADDDAGVTYDNCVHASGYVCLPTWYGGQGLLGGFVCRSYLTFQSPWPSKVPPLA